MDPVPQSLRSAAQEARARLAETLALWFPRCVSSEGGFRQAFARDWSPLADTTRFQVFQARMTWVAAVAAERFPERRSEFAEYVRHGLEGIALHLLDRQNGGTYWQVNLEARQPDQAPAVRRAYGAAFELFARAAATRILGDWEPSALQPLETFHDGTHGGWFEELSADGKPTGCDKVFNTHLHVFEALLEWGDRTPSTPVTAWLAEMVEILEGQMATPSGRMIARFDRAWNPLSDVWEIGHDLEAAYLLLESGLGDPARPLRTIDFALAHGFDYKFGGFFHEGNASEQITDDSKVWWTQDEGLNALIEAWKVTEEARYEEAILRQWAWIRDRQWDAEYGGVFACLTRDGIPEGSLDKANPWKAAYHDVRALRNLSRWA